MRLLARVPAAFWIATAVAVALTVAHVVEINQASGVLAAVIGRYVDWPAELLGTFFTAWVIYFIVAWVAIRAAKIGVRFFQR